MNFNNFFNSAKYSISKHGPEILTGIGIAGMIGTTVMAVKATPKAIHLLEAKKAENPEEKISPIDVIKTTWKCYIPAVITGVTSTACLIGATSISARRNAALVTAYNLSKVTIDEYKQYKDKVVEAIGEKKNQVIKDEINQERIDKDPVSKSEVIVLANGKTLFYDKMFGRYFRSDIYAIEKAINRMNRKIVSGEMYVSLNDFYDEIGLERVDIGDKLGWNLDDGELEVDLHSAMRTDDGDACIVMDFNVPPKYEYNFFS